MIDKRALLKASNLRRTEVDMGKWWGEKVWVRELTARERQQFSIQLASNEGEMNMALVDETFWAKLVQMATVDEEGSLVFDTEDIDALAEQSGSAIQHLAEEIMTLSGMTEKGAEEAKE